MASQRPVVLLIDDDADTLEMSTTPVSGWTGFTPC